MRLKFLLIAVFLHVSTATKLPDGHLQPIGNSGPNVPVEVFDGFPKPAHFVGKYMKEKRPLVMRGALKDSPAFKLWNDDYLRSKAPSGKEGNVFIEYGKKENRSDPSADIHFHKFLDQYNTSDMYMVNHVPAFLSQDVVMPFCIQCDVFTQNFADTVMWFSSGGTRSVFHNDGFENINCLYRGRKHLVMANVTKYESIMPKILDVKSAGHSSVDVDKVDLFKYPFFVGMEFHIADMTAGDCLYIPFGWLHHVSSTGSNLAVNVWMEKTKIKTKDCRDKPDNTLTLNKFTFKIKDEEAEEAPPAEAPPAESAESEAEVPAIGQVLENLASLVLGEGTSASKKTYMRKLTEGKAIKAGEDKILHTLFKVLDRNKNGKWEESEMGDRFSPKMEKLIMRALKQWRKIARKYGISYDINGEIGSESSDEPPPSNEDTETLPENDPTIYTTISDKDEL